MRVRNAQPLLGTATYLLLASAVLPNEAYADVGESSAQSAAIVAPISATRTYSFAEGAIYAVQTSPGRVTDIALQPGETLGAVASGDTARWVIGDTTSGSGDTQRAHVLIKPSAAGLSTNLVITTDRRVYHLTVTSAAKGAMSAVAWSYPRDALLALERSRTAIQAAAPVASGVQIEQLRFDYDISGDDPTWRPLRAFDDGRQTFIEFPASIEVGQVPPLFLVNAKGEAELVNYRLRGRYYVVDRLFDVAELRLGTEKQQIVRIRRVGRGERNTDGRRGS